MSKTEKPTILTDVYGTRPPKAQGARRNAKPGDYSKWRDN